MELQRQGPAKELNYLGLTKREWFAGMVMQGLMANPTLNDETARGYATRARGMANAMLKELEETVLTKEGETE